MAVGRGELLTGQEGTVSFNNSESITICSSWAYSVHGKNFVKTMPELMERKNGISTANDQVGSPTYAVDLAEVILLIISSGNLPAGRQGWQPGIYHFCNEGVTNWFEFAQAIGEISGSQTKINSITTSQYPTSALRPAYSILATGKIQNSFGIAPKNWKESLVVCMDKLTQKLS